MHSYIRIVALRLGTLAVQRGGMQHAVLEKNHKTVFGGYLQKMEGPLKQPKTRPNGRKGLRPEIILALT